MWFRRDYTQVVLPGNVRILSTAGDLTMQEVLQTLHPFCVCRSVTKQPVRDPLSAGGGHLCWPLPQGFSRVGWAVLLLAQAVLND